MFLIKFIKYKHCCYSFLDPHKKKRENTKKSKKYIFRKKQKTNYSNKKMMSEYLENGQKLVEEVKNYKD
jgi:hypothetical protein